ncbi:MAG: thioredoxin domain-containing protein [Chloroflexi bacterium]|nr:thioredoxin domain-containing protein [Chloroflexota bacterium]
MAKKRSRTNKKQRQLSQQKQQQFMLIGGGAVVAVALFIGVILFMQNDADVEACAATDEECYGTYLAVEERGLTDEQIPYIGPEDAPIIIAEFSNFECVHCKTYHDTVNRIIEQHVQNGEAQFQYLPLSNTSGSRVAARAAVCAAEQDAFWQFHSELFEFQGTGSFNTDSVQDIADEMGLDIDALEDCMNSNVPDRALNQARTLSSRLGVTGTPTVAYSLDNGQTWQVLERRDLGTVSALIAQANAQEG